MTDAPCLTLFQQEVEQTVVKETPFQVLHPSTADAVEQIVVYIVHPQPLERLAVHLHGCLKVP